MKLKLIIGAMVAAAFLGLLGRLAWIQYTDMRDERDRLQTQIEVVETNVELLTDLLEEEKETREATQEALDQLLEDVPDAVFRTDLPPQIQRVIDGFHARIRNAD